MTSPTTTPKSQKAAQHLLAAAEALQDFKIRHAIELVAGGYKPDEAERFVGMKYGKLTEILHGGK